MKCNETLSKWCKNKHGASKIMDTLETYQLPSGLWSLRTTPNAATQETPFFLVHDAEAVLPVEITHEAPRIAAYDETISTEALQDDVDALYEARDVALARATQYQQSLQNYHCSRVRP
jgi:hypothetical protein